MLLALKLFLQLRENGTESRPVRNLDFISFNTILCFEYKPWVLFAGVFCGPCEKEREKHMKLLILKTVFRENKWFK